MVAGDLHSAGKFCALLSTHLIFVSEENQRTAEALGIGRGKPSSLIRSGIHDPTGFSHGDPVQAAKRNVGPAGPSSDKLHIPENAWVITYVGNFKPQKNTRDLIKVAEQVLLQSPNTHFSAGGRRTRIAKASSTHVSERNLESTVHLLGWLKRKDDIQEVLQFSDCFLLTSLCV